MSLLTSITSTLGQKVWKQTLVVLTHANGGETGAALLPFALGMHLFSCVCMCCSNSRCCSRFWGSLVGSYQSGNSDFTTLVWLTKLPKSMPVAAGSTCAVACSMGEVLQLTQYKCGVPCRLYHCPAAREKLGKEYAAVSKQRRNILQNILRQAAGEMQLRTPFHLVDLHPDVSVEWVLSVGRVYVCCLLAVCGTLPRAMLNVGFE